MARLRYNNQLGALGAALNGSDTTITFEDAPDFATITGSDFIPLILDPPSSLSPSVVYEVVHLTAYTSGATTGTIARAQEGTSASLHSEGAAWMCGPTALSEGEEATRALAAEALLAPLASPEFTGTPTAPTKTAGDDSTAVATTAYADAAVAAEQTRATGAEADFAPIASPTFTGSPKAPTKSADDDSTNIATTAYVDSAVGVETTRAEGAQTTETNRAEAAEELLAPLASPALTGTPTAPTQTAGNNTTRIATTAFVTAAAAAAVTSAETAAEAASDAAGAASAVKTAGATLVFHGATASTARPSGWGHVIWIGSVTPTNIDEDNDIWLNTSS